MDFPETRWSMICKAGAGDEQALEEFAKAYHKSIYAFISACTRSPEAEDLAQDFFSAKFLEKRILGQVNRDRGRFRFFLKECLRNFVKDRCDPNRVRPRPGCGSTDIHWEAVAEEGSGLTLDLVATLAEADVAMDRTWAETIIERARSRALEGIKNPERRELLTALLLLIENEEASPPRAELAKMHGITESNLNTALFRLKANWGQLIREEIRQSVRDSEAFVEEMGWFRSLFARSAIVTVGV